MPFFECSVSRTVFTDDLTTKRATENVYVEAKDEREAKQKAGHLSPITSKPATEGRLKTSRCSFVLEP
jgi:hypothetical protein